MNPRKRALASSEEQRTRYKLRELTCLSKIGEALGAPLELESIAHRVMEILYQEMGMTRGTLALVDEDSGDIVIVAGLGMSPEELAKGRYRPGEGIIGRVAVENRPIIVPNVGKEPGFLDRTGARAGVAKEDLAFIGVPLKFKGRVLGALTADRLFDDKTVSLEEDLRVLTTIAALFGQAVELHRLHREETRALQTQADNLEAQLKAQFRISDMVGNSPLMEQVYESVASVATSRATVLLRGESGTGKEVVARAIHANSPRAREPFVRVNCAALPETLLESELFGHEKGAFTGAATTRKGRFELADGGTLFLDEIGDISPTTQVKLLRVLQEMSFERVGGNETIHVDVRVVTATHRNLEALIAENKFREDLYYRLNVVPIFLPPLRERSEDIPLLVEHFRRRFCTENDKKLQFSEAAVWELMHHNWPGNVRELENAVERLVVMSPEGTVTGEAVSRLLSLMPSRGVSVPLSGVMEARAPQAPPAGEPPISVPRGGGRRSLRDGVEAIEREEILAALTRCGWVQARAARLLGITPRMIGYKIKKYDLSPDDPAVLPATRGDGAGD
ncbi:MAG: nif-specific transcriptional activator NifA [Nitrospirota bacterium]|nr:nif-specific transcriptional activator NifA [Nitrospirota bacterium]